MKNIIFILIFTILSLEAKPCTTDIYFGNGVWNTQTQGEEGRDELKKFMQKKAITPLSIEDEKNKLYAFKHAYNPSHGTLLDLVETFWQLKESGQISDGYFHSIYAGLMSSRDGNHYYDKLQQIISTYNEDINTMFSAYKTSSFDQKHNVLLVAHSQGNLFGNKMYTLLGDAQKNKFRIVSVATPANYVKIKGQTSPYVTATLDYIIGPIPGSLPGNVDGIGHTFVGTYLNSSINAPRKIALHVKSAYDNLLQTTSCESYAYFVWIQYICPTRDPQELVVDIYGRGNDISYPYIKKLVISDTKVRMPKDSNGICMIQGNDKVGYFPEYNKGECYAYSLDDTTGGYHSLEYVASHTYNYSSTCTQYKMDPSVTETLEALQ